MIPVRIRTCVPFILWMCHKVFPHGEIWISTLLAAEPLQFFVAGLRIVSLSFLFLTVWFSRLWKALASFALNLLCVWSRWTPTYSHHHRTRPLTGFKSMTRNIWISKDPHLRACRHDSHLALSYSQQTTWASISLVVAGVSRRGWSAAAAFESVDRTWMYLSPGYVNIENPSSVLGF